MPARWREPIQPTLILIFILTLLLSVLEQICALNDCRYRFLFIHRFFFVWIYGNEIESGSHRIAAYVRRLKSFTKIDSDISITNFEFKFKIRKFDRIGSDLSNR